MKANSLLRNALSNPYANSLSKIMDIRNDSISAQTTGTKFKNFSQMRSEGLLQNYDSVQTSMANLRSTTLSNQSATSFMNAQLGALNYLQDLVMDVQNFVVSASAIISPNIIQSQVSDFFDRLIIIANQYSSVMGYIFGGSMKNIPPIQDTGSFKSNTNIINDIATSNYTDIVSYQGKMLLGEGLGVNTDIDITDDSFTESIAALHLLQNMTNTDTYSKSQVLSRLTRASQNINIAMAKISQNLRIVDSQNQLLRVESENANTVYDSVFRTNIVENFVQQSQTTSSLESMATSLKITMDSNFAVAKKLYES
ncbi:MAG: hypothetical protein SFT68_00075 [Rickettsiaceae bacterium]|nr:hypothetical protein [Rickettsiaceae bacterium]